MIYLFLSFNVFYMNQVPPSLEPSFDQSMFTDETSLLLPPEGVSLEEVGPAGKKIISKLDDPAIAEDTIAQRPSSKSQGKPKSAGGIRQHSSAGSSRFQLSGSVSVSDHKEVPPKPALPPMMRIFTTMCVDKGTMTDLPPEQDDEVSIGEETVSLAALSMASGSVDREKFVQSKRKQIISATKSFRNNMENSLSSTTLPSQDAVILSLQNSPNPLATLHQYYWKYIPSVFRARLLSTSVVSTKFVSEKSALDILFDSVRMELEKIEFCLRVGLRGIDKCTELTLSLIAVGDVERLDDKFRDLMAKVLTYVRF
jgi:hypothetical protein